LDTQTPRSRKKKEKSPNKRKGKPRGVTVEEGAQPGPIRKKPKKILSGVFRSKKGGKKEKTLKYFLEGRGIPSP